MKCPRCNTELSEQNLHCPVCRKDLSPPNAGPMRIALTGEPVAVPTPAPIAPVLTQSFNGTPVLSPSAPVKIVSANSAFRAAARQLDPSQVKRFVWDRRWLMVGLAGFCFLLWVMFAVYPPSSGIWTVLGPYRAQEPRGFYGDLYFLLWWTRYELPIIVAILIMYVMPPPRSWRPLFRLGHNNPVIAVLLLAMLAPGIWIALQQAERNQAATAPPGRRTPMTQNDRYRHMNWYDNRGNAAAQSILYMALMGYGVWWLLARPQNLIGQPRTSDDTGLYDA